MDLLFLSIRFVDVADYIFSENCHWSSWVFCNNAYKYGQCIISWNFTKKFQFHENFKIKCRKNFYCKKISQQRFMEHYNSNHRPQFSLILLYWFQNISITETTTGLGMSKKWFNISNTCFKWPKIIHIWSNKEEISSTLSSSCRSTIRPKKIH